MIEVHPPQLVFLRLSSQEEYNWFCSVHSRNSADRGQLRSRLSLRVGYCTVTVADKHTARICGLVRAAAAINIIVKKIQNKPLPNSRCRAVAMS